MQNMFEKIDAVIFDLDGSLVDSMWMWKDIDIEYLDRFGIPLPDDLQSKIEGMSLGETAVYFKEHFHIPDSVEQMKADWNEMAGNKYRYEVPFKPYAREFLEACIKKGIRLGIATSNSRELVGAISEALDFQKYFSCIVTGCDVERGKPFPDIYLKAASGLGVSPANCLVFEDIIPGIRAGKAAGMRVCAVEDAYSAKEWAAKQAEADYYIENYSEAIERLSVI